VAGINVQLVRPNNWGFEGDTVTVMPNGKFSMESEGTRKWDVEATESAARKYLDFIVKGYINPGDLMQARNMLRELIKQYPGTVAKRLAEDRLGRTNLQGPGPMVPDE